MNSLRVLLLGASGGIGSCVGRLAAERGHDVTALIRPHTPYDPPPGVDLVRGEVLQSKTLDGLLPGREVVVSCLGLKRTWKSPYARLLSPPDLVATVTRSLVIAMHARGVPRLILVSAGVVGSSRARTSWLVRRLIDAGNLGVAYADLARAEVYLADSGLDYLMVRPVTLTNGRPTGRGGLVARYGILSTVRRADVAAWIVDALEQSEPFVPKDVMIGTNR